MGCGVAVLAMLTGQSYRQVADQFTRPDQDFAPPIDLSGNSPSPYLMDCFLAEHGFFIARLYEKCVSGRKHAWPPAPPRFAAYCNVKERSEWGWSRWVVWLPDGRVLDPERESPRRLSDFELLHQVIYVFPT